MTALAFHSKRAQIRDELAALAPKYVIGDASVLRWYFDIPENELRDELCEIPPSVAARPNFDVFPWNQKVIFHSGRYYVFEVVKPIGKIAFD